MTTTKLKFAGAAVAALAVGLLIVAEPGLAQQPGPNAGPPGAPDGAAPLRGPRGGGDRPWMRGPRGGGEVGMMRGPGGRMCDERLSRFAQMRLERIERVVKPTDAQKQAFADFKTASTKAADLVRAACPTEAALTPTGRLETAEKLTDARLQAIRTVRPALDNFYKALTDEQKARFNALSSHRGPRFAGGDWRERWHHMWRNFGPDQNRGGWRNRGDNDRDGHRRWGDNDRDGRSRQGDAGNPERRSDRERGNVDRSDNSQKGTLDQEGSNDQGRLDGRASGDDRSDNMPSEEHL
jgi:LTXXQ motif family protein